MVTKDKVNIEIKKNPIITETMDRVENWLFSEILSISNSSQIIAYHLACLTEERFRTAVLTGGDSMGRNDVAVLP